MRRSPDSTRSSARRASARRSRAAAALVAAGLVCVPAGIAAAAGPAAPAGVVTPVRSTSSPLSWAPPALTAPTTVVVSPSRRNLKLDDAKDYVVKMPATPLQGAHGLQIHGGRNVVLIGGEIELPAEAITGSVHAGRGLYLHSQEGTVHVEGLRLTGPGLEDGINIDAPAAVVQLQNIRVDLAHGSHKGHHADVLQSWSGPRVLRIDGLTGYSQYQGLFLLPTQYGAAEPEGMDIRRTDLHGLSESGYMIWRDGLSWPLTAQDVYVAPKNPHHRDSFLWPKGTVAGTSAWPSVVVGAPAAGEFVPASDVGLRYVSPGYAAEEAPATSADVVLEPVVPQPPVGVLDSVTPVPGGLRVTGWAADRDTTEPLGVDVTVGGTAHRVVADRPRADVAQRDPGLPAATGFDAVVPLAVGTHQVCVTAVDAGSGGDTALGCRTATVADTTAPTVIGPLVSLRPGTVSSAGVVPVTAAWSVTDDLAVRESRLTSPVTGTYAAGTTVADHLVAAGRSTWNVQATDTAGNTGTATSSVSVTLVPETTAARSGYWWTRNGAGYLRGSAVCTNRVGASLSHTFTGRSVSWVATKESKGGVADVYVDGVKEATVDLRGPRKAADRSVVFTRSWSTAGAHTIKVVVVQGGKDKQVTSDGFVTVG